MDNMSVNLFATSTKEVKADKANVKSSRSANKDSGDSFDNQLSKVKTKETKTAKSVVKEKTKNIAVNKPIDIKSVDEAENKETASHMILSLINSVLQIPVEDIQHILEKMNIQPTDLLNKETFKEFLTYAYPDNNEQQLLFNSDKLKDISKLFTKLEEISTLMDGGQTNIVIQKLMTQDKVIDTTTTTTQIAQIVQNKSLTTDQTIKNNFIENMISKDDLSEEGFLDFKQFGMGINIPIQAFNTTQNAVLWDAQTMQTAKGSVSQLLQDNSLATQIVNKLDITALGTHKEITMQLSPKELGNLSIKLVENNGVLVANIRVENEKTKDLLLSEIKQLEATLEKQGLSISEVKVDVGQNPHQSQMEQQRQKSTRRIQELIDSNLIEEQEDTRQVDEVTGELVETEVNYMV